MSKRGRSAGASWLLAVAMILLPFIVGGFVWLLTLDKNVAVMNPQGAIAAQQKDLIIFTLILSAIVVVPVFIMLGVFAWKYRADNKKAMYTPDVEGNRAIEALWWGIPILIIAVLSVITWITTHQLDPYKKLDSDVKPVKVQVVALQWKWLFIYPEQELVTINELKIPARTPIEFEITADGPMSAFWIPNLGTQTYAMTGMTAKLSLIADNEGIYRGSNSNISGEGYSDMYFNAVAIPEKEFADWAKETAIERDSKGYHFEWPEYEKLAEPSKADKVAYFHLHDPYLFDKIVAKFMHGGAMSSHADGDKEHGH